MNIDFGLIWVVVILISIVLEGVTLALVSIWFALGGVVAYILNLLGLPPFLQILSFIVFSSLSLALFIKNKDKFKASKEETRTNLDSVLEQVGVVRKEITKHSPGIVFIQGKEWTAISSEMAKIEEGKEVKVLKIKGVKLIVEEVSITPT